MACAGGSGGLPPKHWHEEHILRSFSSFCDIVEIDPACLTSFDYSSLRLVLAVQHRLEIPSELWVDADDPILGGCIVSIMPIRVWPRADQLDEDGNLVPVIGLPPSPLPPGPMGPL
jgi:hypothetical protein